MSEAVAEMAKAQSSQPPVKEKREPIAGMVRASVRAELDGYAKEQDRTISYILAKVVEAGLPIYRAQIGKSDGMVS